MFIVIEGIDGTGKATQTLLLKEHLEKQGNFVDVYDFPAYESFVGKELGGLLSGSWEENFDASSLPGKIMAMLFSLDRMQFLERIKSSLARGRIVISNRYSLSNAAFQSIRCGKDISSWVYELEHVALGLPKPDLYIVLKGSAESSQDNVGKKEKRNYTDGHDLYERDQKLLIEAQNLYCSLNTFGVPRAVVNCLENGQFRPRKDINSEIVDNINIYQKPLKKLAEESNLAGIINILCVQKELDNSSIAEQIKLLDKKSKLQLELLATKLKNSELGKEIGLLKDIETTTPENRIAIYIFFCTTIKKLIPMLFETPPTIKNAITDEICQTLHCTPDCIVKLNRYAYEILGE